VGTLGLILAGVGHPTDVQDRDGAELVSQVLRHRFSRLRLIVGDAISNGGIAEWVRALRPRSKLRLESVSKQPGAKEFSHLKFRWRVERTFAWPGWSRRLSKGNEGTTSGGETFVKLAKIHLMARRLIWSMVF
jgi:hypothetical protein